MRWIKVKYLPKLVRPWVSFPAQHYPKSMHLAWFTLLDFQVITVTWKAKADFESKPAWATSEDPVSNKYYQDIDQLFVFINIVMRDGSVVESTSCSPAPTWQLTTICNFRSRGCPLLLSSGKGHTNEHTRVHTHTGHRYTHRQNIHTHEISK